MRSTQGLIDPETVIINNSSYDLSEVEKSALSKGLKFALPPRKLDKGDYFSRFEVLFNDLDNLPFKGTDEDKYYLKQKVGEIAYSSLYNFNMSRSKLMNLPKEEYDALIKLSKNKEIIIAKPDKGSGIVILDRSDYVNKMNSILSDTSKFRMAKQQDVYKISRTIESKVRRFLKDQVYKPGYISEFEYQKLYPNGSHVGIMYGLPKVHKSGCPLRPICSAIGTSTYELGKYISKIIKPASLNSNGTDLRNTFDFVSQVSNCDVSDKFMVSFDVQSLFTNVPLARTVDICMDRLYRSSLTPPSLPEDVLRELINLCVANNTFIFDGKIYQQHDGVAMGSSLGPILANIWMCYLEEEYFIKSNLYPEFYRRYVDDTFCIFNSKESADLFLEFLNSIDDSTKFDVEYEHENKLGFWTPLFIGHLLNLLQKFRPK